MKNGVIVDLWEEVSRLRIAEQVRFNKSLYRKLSNAIKPRAKKCSKVKYIMKGGVCCGN